jgi:NADH dehydrogenase
VAEAMARSLARNETIGQTFELGGPDVRSLRELVQYTAAVLGLRRWIVPLPDLFARLQGLAFDYLPVPLKAFSSDNFNSLSVDSVASRNGLAELGIEPTSFEQIVPGYLGHGKQSQFDEYRSEAGR